MGNPSYTTPENRAWREQDPAERLKLAIEHSAEFMQQFHSGPRPFRALVVSGGDAFDYRDQVAHAMARAAHRVGPLQCIFVGRDRWPGAEFRAAEWARNRSYAVHCIEVHSSIGAAEAEWTWRRIVVAIPGLRGIVAFPGADEDLLRIAASAGIKAWRPYG